MAMDCDLVGVLLSSALTPVVALVFFFWGLTANRPKLIVAGGGSGTVRIAGERAMACFLAIKNEPTFWGRPINREPARITSAALYDPAIKRYLSPALRWQGTTLTHDVTIEPGRVANLYIFAKIFGAQEYFVYNAETTSSEVTRPITSFQERKKDFVIVITDHLNRQYRIRISAWQADNSVDIHPHITWRNRADMVREAFGLLGRAFKPRS